MTHPSDKYAKSLVSMAVCLGSIDRKEDKQSKIIKNNIIIKSAVSVKNNVSKQKIFIAITSSNIMRRFPNLRMMGITNKLKY